MADQEVGGVKSYLIPRAFVISVILSLWCLPRGHTASKRPRVTLPPQGEPGGLLNVASTTATSKALFVLGGEKNAFITVVHAPDYLSTLF